MKQISRIIIQDEKENVENQKHEMFVVSNRIKCVLRVDFECERDV